MAEPVAVATLEEFLANHPPGSVGAIAEGFNDDTWTLQTERFKLWCEVCEGERHYYGGIWEDGGHGVRFTPKTLIRSVFLNYTCVDCSQARKAYAVRITYDSKGDSVTIQKFGEAPPFGKPLPPRLFTLLRDSGELLKAARRCENQNLGIGAFAYYRRVIDNQKNKLFDEIIRATATIGGYEDLIADLERAKKEQSFSASVEAIKHALPESLMVKGQNPLTLLYGALSGGLHGHTDEDCLARATAIRVVLIAFAEKIHALLLDDGALNDAVKLLRKPAVTEAAAAAEIPSTGPSYNSTHGQAGS